MLMAAIKRDGSKTCLVIQWLRICLAMYGMQVQPLVQELRSHKPEGKAHSLQLLKPGCHN